MHRNTLAVLAAVLGLAGCTKSPPPTPEAKPVAPSVSAHLPPAPATSRDAGTVAAPERVAPVLGLAHRDVGVVNHLARARALKLEGDSVETLAEARKLLADSPEDEEALALVARSAAGLGQNALAAAAFERLACVREEDAVPLVQAARLQLLLKDSAAAARLASEALGRDDGNVEAYQVLGRAALVDGDLRRAMDWLEQAEALAPSHGWVLNNLGFAYLRANENAHAVETLSRAAELLPSSAVVHNNLGVALERMGRTEEATASFEHSAELAPHYSRALVNRARLAMLRTRDAGASPEEDDGCDDASAEE